MDKSNPLPHHDVLAFQLASHRNTALKLLLKGPNQENEDCILQPSTITYYSYLLLGGENHLPVTKPTTSAALAQVSFAFLIQKALHTAAPVVASTAPGLTGVAEKAEPLWTGSSQVKTAINRKRNQTSRHFDLEIFTPFQHRAKVPKLCHQHLRQLNIT